MSAKRSVYLVVSIGIVLVLFFGCAGTPEVVEEEPGASRAAETAEPDEEQEPPAWIAAVNDAKVMIDGKSVAIPAAYDPFSLIIKAPETDVYELHLIEEGSEPVLLMEGNSTLKTDAQGRVAFTVTYVNEEPVQALFDVLGLRALDPEEMRDAYYLFGEFSMDGPSILKAYDMGRVLELEFNPMM